METLPATATAQDDSSSANPSSVKSDDSSPRHEGGRGSPPPNCAICLGACRNKSFTDSCLHQFCFKCLLTWSKVKAVCPLCKQNFRSIIHNVRSNSQYEEYMVDQRHTDDPPNRINIENLVTASRRFRYRTTLTMPRRETLAFQQLLLHYPMMTEVYHPPSLLPRRHSPASFRRSVYRYNLYARPLPDFTGRFRDCTPAFYRYNTSQMHRLIPWLNRELHYLLNENVGHISYVMSRILDLLPHHHVSSSEFREGVARFFGDRTEHFLHELYCFASTPYDMSGYDRHVQYTTNNRLISVTNEVISSSESEASVDSDIVMVSSSEPIEPPPGPSRVPAPVYPQNYIPEPSTAHNNVIPIETISHSDTDDDSSEVMVVGYIKPPQDRTPEVVDLLGSDSDVIVQENTPEQPQNVETQESRPPLLVKLTLKKHNNRPAPDSESDGSTYTPSPPRRKIWNRNNGNATTSDTSRETPSPVVSNCETSSRNYSWSSTSYSPTSSSEMSSDSTPSSSASESEESVKRKRRRKTNSTEKRKRKNKRQSRSHHKSKKVKRTTSKEKQCKRKSYSGKGVKSSKTKNDASTSKVTQETHVVSEEPSTSGLSKRKKQKRDRPNHDHRSSRESKRLKSVVNVINSSKQENSLSTSNADTSENQNESKIPRYNTNNLSSEVESGLNCVSVDDADNTDSDDLPLNLTIVKSLLSSSKM